MQVNLRIVLAAPRNSLNMGVAARAMANFGFSDLRVVNPFMPSWEEAKSAVKAESILKNAKLCATLEEALEGCALTFALTCLDGRPGAGKKIIALPGAIEFITNNYAAQNALNAALVFGQEKRGLTNAEIALSNAVLHIPTSKEQPSMNLAQAVTVCCYEFSKLNKAPEYNNTAFLPANAENAAKAAGEINEIFELIKFESHLSGEQRLLGLKSRLMAAQLTEDNLDYIHKIILRLKKFL